MAVILLREITVKYTLNAVRYQEYTISSVVTRFDKD